MAKTQHRAHSALSGRRFSSFAGKGGGAEVTPHPVGILLQHRGYPPLTHKRYGSFAGRGVAPAGPHPVGVLTQHRPHAAFGGRRYGSFAGRGPEELFEWFLTGVEELDFSAELTASGDFALGSLLQQEGVAALIATLEVQGNFTFAIAEAVTPGSRFIGPRVGLRANGELIILF